MDSERLKLVSNRMTAAFEKELLSWNRVEKTADRLSEMGPKFTPINLHKGVDFKFKQMYDAERAAYIQDEISDLLNAEKYA